MADTAVSTTTLTPGAASADLVGGGTAVSTGNTAVIDVDTGGGEHNLVLVFQETASAVATLSVEAGDYPPSPTAGLGADSISMAADDVLVYQPEMGRHLQNNGTIRVLVTGAVKVFAFRLQAGY